MEFDLKNKNINERLKYFRKLRGFTQKEFAKELDMSVSTYARLERDGYIRDQLMLDIAAILKIDPRYILLGELFKPSNIEEVYERFPPELFNKELTMKEENAIMSLRCLNKDHQNFIFEIINLLYLKKRGYNRF